MSARDLCCLDPVVAFVPYQAHDLCTRRALCRLHEGGAVC